MNRKLTAGSLLFRARTSISKREVTQSLRDAEHVFGLAEVPGARSGYPRFP